MPLVVDNVSLHSGNIESPNDARTTGAAFNDLHCVHFHPPPLKEQNFALSPLPWQLLLPFHGPYNPNYLLRMLLSIKAALWGLLMMRELPELRLITFVVFVLSLFEEENLEFSLLSPRPFSQWISTQGLPWINHLSNDWMIASAAIELARVSSAEIDLENISSVGINAGPIAAEAIITSMISAEVIIALTFAAKISSKQWLPQK